MTLVHETPVHERKFVRLQPPSRFDLNGSTVLQQQINATEPEQDDLWLVDMAHVEFIDSAGILALINVLTLARHLHCRLLVCNLRPSIKLVFEIAQLDQAFEIVDGSTEPDCLTHLYNRPRNHVWQAKARIREK